MRTFNIVTLLVLTISLVSCNKDEYYDKSMAISGESPDGVAVVIMEPPSNSDDQVITTPDLPGETPDKDIVVTSPQPDPVNVEVECAKAIKEGTIKEKVYNLSFEEVLDCPWGIEDNVSGSTAKNCTLGARSEIEKKILLPNDVNRFCELNFKFTNDKQRYDDEVVFTLQDYVLISSQDYSSTKIADESKRFVRDADGLMKFDWTKLYLAPYYKKTACKNSNMNIEHYCLGYVAGTPEYEANCILPPTEKMGKMSINLPKQSIYKLSSKIGMEFDKNILDGQDKELSLKLITIGDNDYKDCGHKGADIVVKVQYISK